MIRFDTTGKAPRCCAKWVCRLAPPEDFQPVSPEKLARLRADVAALAAARRMR